jgi:hypothetical protein
VAIQQSVNAGTHFFPDCGGAGGTRRWIIMVYELNHDQDTAEPEERMPEAYPAHTSTLRALRVANCRPNSVFYLWAAADQSMSYALQTPCFAGGVTHRDRDDVETITLNSVVLVRCRVCNSIHSAVPVGEVIQSQGAFRQKVDQLADAHKGSCLLSVVPRCGTRCPATGCASFCILDAGHAANQGHFCNNSHQW